MPGKLSVWTAVLLLTAVLTAPAEAAVHLAMGFRVGDVTQTTAVVWTRLTARPERNTQGRHPPQKESPTRVQVQNLDIPPDDYEGAVPGAAGQVRLRWSPREDLGEAVVTDWVAVAPEADFTHQFRLRDLRPGQRYHLRVEARAEAGGPVTPGAAGSFRTAPAAQDWQDVRFTVLSCQMYYHRDRDDGFHIYPAMARLKPHFVVPTGDSVYYDRDNPRAKTVPLCRLHWQRMYSLPTLVAFHRDVPGYWLKDDHDTFFDDCWTTYKAPWIEPLTYAEGVRVFREQVPFAGAPFRTVRWGQGLQVWLTEVRDFRSPNTDPDGPAKTVWGAEQKAWLKRTLLASDATFKVLLSPTALVGPDNANQKDNHANRVFAHEGEEFRCWTREQGLRHVYVCTGDRHWQYFSTDPHSGLREFACGPASDVHAVAGPGYDPRYHSFYRAKGGFLSVTMSRPEGGVPAIAFRFHDVHGAGLHEFRDTALGGRGGP